MMSELNRAWRLIVAALSFSLFGLAGVLLGVLVMPLVWLLAHPKRVRQNVARWLITRGFRAFVGFMATLGGLRYRITGLEHVGSTRAERQQQLARCLIVANHPSLIDVVFLLAWFPEAICVVKGAHWFNPVFTGSIRAAGYISNADSLSMLLSAREHLEDGEHVLMFPEGTRTEPNQPPHLRMGAATLAITARANVLPVLMSCTPTTLTKADAWYQITRRQVLIELSVLPMIAAEELAAPLAPGQAARQANKAAAQRLNSRLTDLFTPDRQ